MVNPVIKTSISSLSDLLCDTPGMAPQWYANVGTAISELLNAAALENAAQPPAAPSSPTSGNGDTTPPTS